MGSSVKTLLISDYIAIPLLLLLLPSSSSTTEPPSERSLVVAPSAVLQLSHGLPVQNSPGKPGKTVLCERIHIYGFSRIKNLGKFAHSVSVKVSGRNSSVHLPNAEVCFHRNISLAMGMCPEGNWEKVSKGSWVRPMTPFDHKLLDIRTASSSLGSFEVSIEEEFFLHRVIFLVFGIVMMSMASFLSTSLVFYYGSAMVVGIILVILVFLFQGMKLIPFGGKRLAIFIPSSIVGLAYFFKLFIPGALRSLLELVGIDQEMYDPLVKFLLAFVMLAGAWMGFWVVRKLVLKEDGSIDISTAVFVAWSIRILAALMILQSSADPVLATVALVSGIVVSSILRRIFRWRFLRRVYR
ncbi:NEMP family [Trema orientale]|uniref:NEMP family n=1 Tax=Trema orientale TaxID=63057 RepID=A0A2P5FSC4_TREOI|nr:NEMP family [Trema orientale]